MRNEYVDREELRSSEGICRSLGCEVFQADTVKGPCIHDELTTLHHQKQQKTELTVLVSDPNSEFSEEGSMRFESCGTRKIKGGRNLYIKLQEHKLDQIAPRNIRIPLDKKATTSPKENLGGQI